MKKIITMITGTLILVAATIPMLRASLYPIKYKSEIKSISKEYDIDPYLLTSLVHFESRFEDIKYEENSKNGILKFKDESAIQLAKELNMKDFKPESLVNPSVSLKLGSYYISKFSDKGVSEVVQEWSVRNGEKNEPKFNRKEYAKTNYLPKIEKNMNIYRVLYPELKY